MATNPKGEGSHSYRSGTLNRDPQFFKVVMFPFDQGLKIPDAFMEKYRRDLQDTVLLKVPTGDSWRVELVHYGNGSRLLWEKFINFYSIRKYHFLVFRYKGNSQFLVSIFDPTGLEIEYPVGTSSQKACSFEPTELADPDDDEEFEDISARSLKNEYQTIPASIEIFDNLSECKPRTRFSHKLTTEGPHFKRKNAVKVQETPCHPTKASDNTKAKQNQDGNSGKGSMGTSRHFRSSSSISGYKTVPLRIKEKFKSYENAKAFTSSSPFFISFIQPSYVCEKKAHLEIPRKFVRRYISENKKHDPLTLHVSGRTKSWPVTFVLVSAFYSRGRLTTGWKKFAQENGLRVGDVCVFELITGTRKFKVTVYSGASDEIVP